MAYPEITYKDFATLARNRGQTAESLAERFRGAIEENKHELPYIGILTDKPERVVEVPDFIEAKPGQKRPMATYPLNEWFPADLLSLIDRFFNVDFDITLKRARARQNAITVKAEHLMSAGLWYMAIRDLDISLKRRYGYTYQAKRGIYENQSHVDAGRCYLGAVSDPGDSRKNIRLRDHRPAHGGLSR